MALTYKEQVKRLDSLFYELYEGTKTNMENLKSDKKEYETPEPELDPCDIDNNDYVVPFFVKKHIMAQAELMNKIFTEYSQLVAEANAE